MDGLALATAAVLGVLAAVHAHWAFGGSWPASDRQQLVKTVVGDSRLTRMPGRNLTLAVTGAILGAAAVALLLRWPAPIPRGLILSAGVALAFIFLGRGIAGYVPAWRRRHDEQPFSALDRRYYAPLCLLIGSAFLLLVVNA